jgi:hypothetical protein
MKKGYEIKTVESKARLSETLIVEYVNSLHHPDKHFDKDGTTIAKTVTKDFEKINWCCEHSPVEGTLEISFFSKLTNLARRLTVPVSTEFWVVCTQETGSEYKLTWSGSLS